jgi:hypothetical protein
MKSLMRVPEFAEFIGAKPRAVREWIILRRIPYLKIGKMIFIDPLKARASLDRFEQKELK